MPYAAGYDAFGYRRPSQGWNTDWPDRSGLWRRTWRSRGTARHLGGRPFAVVLTILGFLLWWPVGLAILFYVVGSGRMGRVRRQSTSSVHQAQWEDADADASAPAWGTPASDGSKAFDQYRVETLRRMEEEQQEFAAFVERLRFARDKAEFDQFMAERRARPGASESRSAA